MKTIHIPGENIYKELYEAILTMNVRLPNDVKEAILRACEREKGPGGKVLQHINKNMREAEKTGLPMCQDTGMVIVFVDIGENVSIGEGNLYSLIHKAVKDAYCDGYFRQSIVRDPFFDRTNSGDNLPPVIYFDVRPGIHLKISLLAKGFGSENFSSLHMFLPTADRQTIIDAVREQVRTAGASPCPPVIIGMGIGGTADYAGVLSKRALLIPLDEENEHPRYAELEKDIYQAVNGTGIGPGGLGGYFTTLGVKILSYPTHMAGLPIAVSLSCWADRKAVVSFNGSYR